MCVCVYVTQTDEGVFRIRYTLATSPHLLPSSVSVGSKPSAATFRLGVQVMGEELVGSPFLVTTKPRYLIGVGGNHYVGYRMLGIVELKQQAASVAAAFQAAGGFPVPQSGVHCNGALCVAEGQLVLDGTTMANAEYTEHGPHAALKPPQLYVPALWHRMPPLPEELIHAWIHPLNQSSRAKPCLFVALDAAQ
jgi:hypothetical protein